MSMIDIIKSDLQLWDLFTKEEEYEPAILDCHQRFPYYLSKNRNIMEPIVSKFLIKNGYRPFYPNGKKFAVCLTHDIDAINQKFVGCAVRSLTSTIKGNYKDTFKYAYSAIDKKRHPYWNFKYIMDIEAKYDAKSSFYFLSLEPGEQDYSYEIQDLSNEIANISDNGWEVGLHGGHESYNNLEKMMKEKKLLENVIGEKITGYRSHFLKFKTPDTWEIISKAGFEYDTTFGYADCAGFRNGMCHPFKPFNLNTNREIDILEIPLTIMDCTLLRDYMRLDFEKAWQLAKQLIDSVEKYNGVLTVLWHNTYMYDDNLKLYEKILKYCSDKNAWLTSGKNISEHYNSFGSDFY